jgi:hypothetical protein
MEMGKQKHRVHENGGGSAKPVLVNENLSIEYLPDDYDGDFYPEAEKLTWKDRQRRSERRARKANKKLSRRQDWGDE